MNSCVLTLIILIWNVMCLRAIDLLELSELERNEGVSYLTYTRDNKKVAVDIRAVNFNDAYKNVFIIHGFKSESLDKPLQVKDDLFKYRNDVGRVIIVSWLDYSTGSGSYKEVAKIRIPKLATDLSAKIVHIRQNGAKIIELIGHSVGAHAAGQTKRELGKLKNEPVDQIYGLDPTSRYFKDRKDLALNKDDAKNVLVIHTNINNYGFGSEIGTNDIRVNGGEKQPNCEVMTDLCSHNKAWNAFSDYLSGIINTNENTSIHPYVICLDVSGSMKDDKRLDRAMHSVREKILTLKSGTFIGIVKFNQQAEIVHNIIEIKGEAERKALNVSLPSVADGSTSIGAGLRLSMNMLKDKKSELQVNFYSTIVLISDGEQMVGESPQDVLKDLQNEGITVNSIAIGIQASNDLELLSNSTKGVNTYAMEDGSGQVLVGLDKAFLYVFSQNNVDDTVQVASKEVVVEQSEHVQFVIDENSGKDTEFKYISVSVNTLEVKLISPNGTVFTSSSSEYFHELNTAKGFRIPVAVPGHWNFIVSRISRTKRSVQSPSIGTVVVKTHQVTNTSIPTIRLAAVVSNLVLEYPKPITISAELQRGNFPIVLAEVYANIRAPNQPIIRLEMYDNGIFPDELANDGIYKADIKKLPKAERYSVIVIARSNGTAMLVPKKIDYFSEDIVDCKSISCTKLNEFEREADAGSIKLSSTKNENKIPPSKVDDLRGTIENEREKLIALEWTSPNDEFFDIKVKRYDIRALINGTNFENGLKFNANDLVQGSLEEHNYKTTKEEKIVIKVPDYIWNCTLQIVTQLKFALKSVGMNGEISERSNIAYVIINKNNTVADAVKSSSTRYYSQMYLLYSSMFFSIVPALVLLFLFNIFI